MANFVHIPHLPIKKVGLLAIGERYGKALEGALESLDIEAFWLPDAPYADRRLAGHTDLQLLHLGADKLVSSLGESCVNFLTNRGFKVSTVPGPGAEYPKDCALNACIAGGMIFHRRDLTPYIIKDLVPQLKPVNIAQGYAKCCTCVIDERSVITSDHGIAKAAAAHGLAVLEIRQGYIELAGFDYGFIGGASFKLSAHELAFTGRMDAHPDWPRIAEFLAQRGIEPLFLTGGTAFDIGSAVPLTER